MRQLFDALIDDLHSLEDKLSSQEASPFFRQGKSTQALAGAAAQLLQLVSSNGSMHTQHQTHPTHMERLPVGVIAIDDTGSLLLFNSVAESLLDLESADLNSKDWGSFLKLYRDEMSDIPCLPEALPHNEALTKFEPVEREFFARSTKRDDEAAWLKMTAYPVLSDKQLSGAICIVEDVTADKLEQRLKANLQHNVDRERRYESLVAYANDGFVAIDKDGTVIEWNKKAEQLLGFEAKRIIGQPLAKLVVPAKFKSGFEKAVPELFEKGETGLPFARVELTASHYRGHEVTVEVAPFYLNYNGAQVMACFFQDVTQRTKVEKRRFARYVVTRALAEYATFEECAARLLQSIGHSIEWSAGGIWGIDKPTQELQCIEHFATHPSPEIESLFAQRMDLEQLSLAARVWKRGKAMWLENIAPTNSEPQTDLAASAGFKASFAFPVKVNNEVEYVFQFFASENKTSDADMLSLFGDIGNQIGQFVEAKRSEQERQRLAAIVEASDDAIICLSEHGEITTWNRGATKLYGYDPVSLVGDHFENLFSQSCREQAGRMLADVIKTTQARHLETTHVTKSGADIAVAVTISPALDGAGKITSLCLTVRDISERKQKEQEIEVLNRNLEGLNLELQDQLHKSVVANDELEALTRKVLTTKDHVVASSRFKTEFLEKMSREIRTPLNAITGFSEILSKEQKLSSQEQDYASIIRESSTTLLNVFNDIIEYSKLEDGALALEENDFSLTAVVEAAADAVYSYTRRKKLSIVTFVAPDVPPRVKGDANKVRKILVKLLENTFKYMERGGVIVRILLDKTTADRHMIRITFSDVGVGLSSLARAQAEKPFQLDDTQKFDGANLGLSMAKYLVESMGGSIGIEPGSSGTGAAFWAVVPFQKSQHDAPLPLSSSLVGRKILVIDGPAGAARIIHSYCDCWGIMCDWVHTGDDALAIMRRQAAANTPYDLVILENITFGMNGHTLANYIRHSKELRDTDIILYAPHFREHEFEELSQYKISKVMQGPLKQTGLLEEITKIMEKRTPLSQDPMQSGCVLVVEDNHINRKLCKLQLNSLGLASHLVVNGKEAVEAASKNRYALILMDCEMPELDGFAATRAIRKFEAISGRHTPIVAMTANAVEGDRELCLESGMDDYLSKPVENEEMAGMIRKWLPSHMVPTSPADGAKANDSGNATSGSAKNNDSGNATSGGDEKPAPSSEDNDRSPSTAVVQPSNRISVAPSATPNLDKVLRNKQEHTSPVTLKPNRAGDERELERDQILSSNHRAVGNDTREQESTPLSDNGNSQNNSVNLTAISAAKFDAAGQFKPIRSKALGMQTAADVPTAEATRVTANTNAAGGVVASNGKNSVSAAPHSGMLARALFADGEEEMTVESEDLFAGNGHQQAEPAKHSADERTNDDDDEDTAAGNDIELDLDRLRRICGDGGMREVASDFLGSSDKLIGDLEAAIILGNPEKRRKAAHLLNGSCGALGAKQAEELSMAIQLLEYNDDSQSWEKSRKLMAELVVAFKNLKVALKHRLQL